MKFKLYDETQKDVGDFELSQTEIEDDFVYLIEKAISKLTGVPWTHVFLAGMDENLTGLDMYSKQNTFDIIINNKIHYTAIKLNA